jgi:serine protease Do
LKQAFMNPKKAILPPLAALTAAAFLAGGTLAFSASGPTDNGSKASLDLRVDSAPLNRDIKLGNSFAPIVKSVTPSVVKVFVTTTSQRQLSGADIEQFRRFFGPMFPDLDQQQQSPNQHALGSGVVVSPNGYILTNNHVIENAKDIQVALNDGRSFNAKLVGTDPQTDVALLKINANNLPALTLADSDAVEIGDVVLAVGNPFGIGQTVTEGIVSAKDRTNVSGGDQDEDFIQTDAAINPGNSGGALVDTQGRLVGINTSILSRTGGNQGIGFAVPSNLCRWVMDSLVKNGKVTRGFLGVVIQNLTPDLAQAFKVNRSAGALISEVTPNGPADAAGLKNGDVVLQYDNKPIESASQLKLRVAETTPGVNVPVQIDRSGETKSINVVVKERSTTSVAANQTPKPAEDGSLNGVTVQDLTRELRAELKVPGTVQGAVIEEVDPASPSYEAGLRVGDVITEINHRPIKTAQEAVEATSAKPNGATLVKVYRNGGSQYLAVREGSE